MIYKGLTNKYDSVSLFFAKNLYKLVALPNSMIYSTKILSNFIIFLKNA